MRELDLECHDGLEQTGTTQKPKPDKREPRVRMMDVGFCVGELRRLIRT